MADELKTGWNTWNVRSVLSHVLLPEGIAVSLGFKAFNHGRTLREALIGRKPKGKRQQDLQEHIIPGPRTYDGGYTSLELEWTGLKARVESATDGTDWFARVTPLSKMVKTPALTIEAGVLWNRPGYAKRDGEQLVMYGDQTTVTIAATGTQNNDEPVVEMHGPYLLILLDQTVCISSNPGRLADAATVIDHNRDQFLQEQEEQSESRKAMQVCLAWDTIYDPFKDRVISPVSRIWSCNWGGWVLFDWDTYFAALMAAVDNKALAYANAIAITEEATERGFIPNMALPSGFKSRDRSQPPVGAMSVRMLCDRFNETVLAEQLFDALLTWNRWWPEHREQDGYLCWGSDPYEPITGNGYETLPINTRFASALESGLDNSPMYKDMPYDDEVHRMQLADVGLMSFYITDCKELADLAKRIGRDEVIDEIHQRQAHYTEKLETLWCEETGLYLNKRLDNGEFETRLSPTHFYPLLAGVPTQQRAERMINEHMLNPDEFWGEWVLPSIARNDELYPAQNYWQGRIWAPMNFLVYLGLCNYDLPDARKALAEKSESLLLKEWTELGHVHENYHADTGEGCGNDNSDAFYHWGGLLGLIGVMETQTNSNSNQF